MEKTSKNQSKLFLSKQSQYACGNVEHHFTFNFYEEMVEMNAEFDGLLDQVEIKAYRLIIEEVVLDAMTREVIEKYSMDAGIISSRSGEVAYTVSKLSKLHSLVEMEEMLYKLTVDYTIAMKKDAFRALKKKLGLNSSKRFPRN